MTQEYPASVPHVNPGFARDAIREITRTDKAPRTKEVMEAIMHDIEPQLEREGRLLLRMRVDADWVWMGYECFEDFVNDRFPELDAGSPVLDYHSYEDYLADTDERNARFDAENPDAFDEPDDADVATSFLSQD